MKKYIIGSQCTLFQVLQQMDLRRAKFMVVVSEAGYVEGTLTDGDIRRALLRGMKLNEPVACAVCRSFTYIRNTEGLAQILAAFQNRRIEFLPVLDEEGNLCNVITKRGLDALLLQNQSFEINLDFERIDENALEHTIHARPWGFYKTTILNDTFQSKVIYVMPGQALSLQSHAHREEYWIVVNGTGEIQLGESVHPVSPGGSYFIPKGCRHRMTNTSDREVLIFNEVQLGDYFGEDDIKRYEDIYERR